MLVVLNLLASLSGAVTLCVGITLAEDGTLDARHGTRSPAPLMSKEARPKTTEDNARDEEQVEYDEVTGLISVISKTRIAVEYSGTPAHSFEISLTLSDAVKLKHVNDLAALKPGDTVKVRYERRYKEQRVNDRTEKVVLKMVGTDIDLIKTATAGLMR